MIWTDNFNQVPSGSVQETVTFDGESYKVYKSGSYIAFVETNNVTSGTLDLLTFFNHIIAKGWIPSTSTLGRDRLRRRAGVDEWHGRDLRRQRLLVDDRQLRRSYLHVAASTTTRTKISAAVPAFLSAAATPIRPQMSVGHHPIVPQLLELEHLGRAARTPRAVIGEGAWIRGPARLAPLRALPRQRPPRRCAGRPPCLPRPLAAAADRSATDRRHGRGGAMR